MNFSLNLLQKESFFSSFYLVYIINLFTFASYLINKLLTNKFVFNMESNLNPKESFAIIEAVINERKRRYEENGIFLIFWGVLVAITGVAQFLMLRFDFYPEKSGYLWLCTMSFGTVFTIICKSRQGIKNRKQHKVEDWSDFVWLAAGILAFVSMLVLNDVRMFTLVIFLPLGIACLFSALRLKNGLWIATSIFTILLAYSTIRFELEYQPLAMAVIAVLAFLVPGIQLYMNNKERNGDV